MFFKKIRKAVKDNKYLLLKKAVRLETFRLDFNFDMMFALFAKHNHLEHVIKKESVGQIINLNNILIFKSYLDYIETNLKDLFSLGNLDFFYSLKGEVGLAHEDKEHVIILGIKNATYYHVDNVDLEINPGDILYVPKNKLHHSFSSRERIILSLSLWKKN
tara:strand:- start:68 stop:550 length:483 start_codon:yes stop_codon:yes gene_type:complete